MILHTCDEGLYCFRVNQFAYSELCSFLFVFVYIFVYGWCACRCSMCVHVHMEVRSNLGVILRVPSTCCFMTVSQLSLELHQVGQSSWSVNFQVSACFGLLSCEQWDYRTWPACYLDPGDSNSGSLPYKASTISRAISPAMNFAFQTKSPSFKSRIE